MKARATFFAIVMCAVMGITTAHAATLTVNSLADDTTSGNGLVTLREAVAAANADTATDLGQSGSGADTIVFDASLAGGTIALSITGNSTFGTSALAITSAAKISTTDHTRKPDKVMPFCLPMIHPSQLMTRPMRLKSSKFHQTRNALPTMCDSGTNPQ